MVIIYPDGNIRLDTGGYMDTPTLTAMNMVLNLLGIAIEDKGGAWQVRNMETAYGS